MNKVFNHETVHDTANRTMTFIIHKRLQITINFADYEILIIKDGKVIERENLKGEHFSLSDMELILTQANQSAEKLNDYER